MTARAGRSRRPAWRPGRPRARSLLFFLGPGLALYSVIFAYPVLTAFSYSLFEWRGIQRGAFVGLANLAEILSLKPYAQQFSDAIMHNLVFFFGTLALQGTVGMLLALALQRRVRGRRFFQTIISMPYLMSSLVIGYVWTLVLAPQWGPVNAALAAVGLGDWARPWLGDPGLVLPVLILINCWQWVGAGMLIFGAALGSIPEEQLEAARVDGAGYWRIVGSIQLPQIMPAIQVYVVLIFIGAVNVFDLVYAVGGSSGGPGGAADMLGTLFYRISFGKSLNALGLSGAMSVLIFAMLLASTLGIVWVFERLRRRYVE